MTAPLSLHPAARAEYDAAVTWYEAARPGLGDQFERAVESVFATITAAPDRYPVAEDPVREAPVPGFPFCVYYWEFAGFVRVAAVYHQSRRPGGWRGRV